MLGPRLRMKKNESIPHPGVALIDLYFYRIFRSQTCICKKGSDWLKRWVEAQHNIFKLYGVS